MNGMDWLEFFSEIIDSLAWPLAVAIMVFILRRQIGSLIEQLVGRIARLRFGGVQIDFAEVIREVEARAEEANLIRREEAERVIPVAVKRHAGRLYVLAETSTRAAIIEAWLLVENEAREAAERSGLDVEIRTGTLRVLQLLYNTGHIPSNLWSIIDDLRRLRNSAVHGFDLAVSTQIAIAYISLAERVLAHLQDIGK